MTSNGDAVPVITQDELRVYVEQARTIQRDHIKRRESITARLRKGRQSSLAN